MDIKKKSFPIKILLQSLTVSRYARKAYKNNIYWIEPIFKKKSKIFLENRLNPKKKFKSTPFERSEKQ